MKKKRFAIKRSLKNDCDKAKKNAAVLAFTCNYH